MWPAEVFGCAAVVERLVLPPDADEGDARGPEAARDFAAEHPDRQEVRIVAAVTRDGATYCALRMRAHDDDFSGARGRRILCRPFYSCCTAPWPMSRNGRNMTAGSRVVSGFFDDDPDPRRAALRRPPAAALARAGRHRRVVIVVLLPAVRRSPASGPTGCGSAASATPRSSTRCSAPGCCSSSSSAWCSAAWSPPTSRSPTASARSSVPRSPEQVNLDRYREVVEPMRSWLADRRRRGARRSSPAAPPPGQWRALPAVAQPEPFGTEDPYFNKDVGFYVFELPWLHYLVDFAMAATVLGLLAAAVVHYLFGGIRLQAQRRQALAAPPRCSSRCCSACSCSSRPSTTGWTAST